MAVNGIGNSKADIRPTQLKAGMEKTNLKNDKDKAIFDAMDTDKKTAFLIKVKLKNLNKLMTRTVMTLQLKKKQRSSSRITVLKVRK